MKIVFLCVNQQEVVMSAINKFGMSFRVVFSGFPARYGIFLITVLCMIGMSVTAIASPTGRIAGKVIDASTGVPLPGVNIVLEGTMYGAATNLEGEYFMANISPGDYVLRASMVGYTQVMVTDVRINHDRTTVVDIRLEESFIEIEGEVVVVAHRPLVEIDNTMSRTILTTQDIAVHPTPNIQDVLTTLPGINVEGGQVYVRGGGLSEVSILVDGARIRNPMNQQTFIDINMSAIKEMEIITGAFNAEYGEARSGVFNVILRDGTEGYNLAVNMRYRPPGIRHWGKSMYDYSSELYWENSHARHLQWWIEYPDMWVDPNGVPGNNPGSIWTPEQAYENYMSTHQPLTNYGTIPTYDTEVSLGGPFPFVNNLYFFATARYRTEAPLYGNSYRDRGIFNNTTLKLTYRFTPRMKLDVSGFLYTEKRSWGIQDYPDLGWAGSHVLDSRYAYFDFPGLPEHQTDGQTMRFSHVVSQRTMYEISLSRVHAYRRVDVFPDDPRGWEASGALYDNLRAVDENGRPIPGGYQNRVGFNTTGYFFRYHGNYVDWTSTGYLSTHLSRNLHLKSGYEFTYYHLDHFNQSKLPDRWDDNVYNPYQGAAYAQSTFEFGGFIMNAGLRFDFYNPNDYVYTDLFNPFEGERTKTKTFTQLSPRLGVSHPIDDRTVLRFSYGHFFQRGPFGDFGEGSQESESLGSLTTFLTGGDFPWVLGNRNVRPQKTVAFEVGIDRNFAEYFVLSLTGFYKDITNTIRMITIETPLGIYRTNGNSDYADIRGLEVSLRKMPSHNIWGYVNFNTQVGIYGRSGDPVVITPTAVRYAASGDVIYYNNPRLKAGLFMRTPQSWNFLRGMFKDIIVSLEYEAIFPHEQIFQDNFAFEGEIYMRKVDKNANLRIMKEMSFLNNTIGLTGFIEVTNVFNDQWLNFNAFRQAPVEEQRKFVESNFDYIPSVDANGAPILDIVKYRNLPRSIVFGIMVEL